MVVRGLFKIISVPNFKTDKGNGIQQTKPRRGESEAEFMERVRETYPRPRATFYDKDAHKIRKTAW